LRSVTFIVLRRCVVLRGVDILLNLPIDSLLSSRVGD